MDAFEFMKAHNFITPPALNRENIILGEHRHAKYDNFNHLLLYAKMFIHKQFVSEAKLCFRSFLNYYKHVLEIEKARHVEKDQIQNFLDRFKHTTMLVEFSLTNLP